MAHTIAILGGGPAGVALALKLVTRAGRPFDVTVVEQAEQVGGIAGSFEVDGLRFDYGSHRLHRATPAPILRDIKALLGPDLLDRPRHGRIRMFGRFVTFPLDPIEMARKLPPSFLLGIAADTVRKPLRRRRPQRTFADVLLQGLGPTICHSFYFPYARKLWGLEAHEIAAVQAHRRVGSKSIGKTMRKVLARMPGLRREGAGNFYYPRMGFGQISEATAEAAEQHGAAVWRGRTVEEVHLRPEGGVRVVTAATAGGEQEERRELDADFLFSTIPTAELVRRLQPPPPTEVAEAAARLRYQGMVLCYLILETERFTPYDCHYFPDASILVSRVSEPSNYTDRRKPRGRTGLCAEIPCATDADLWSASDDEVMNRVIDTLDQVGLSVRGLVVKGFVRRQSHAYPVYSLDFEEHFHRLDDYLFDQVGVVTLGRQGLFAHDNTHHTIEMAHRASECLSPELEWNARRWAAHRLDFSEHVVED